MQQGNALYTLRNSELSPRHQAKPCPRSILLQALWNKTQHLNPRDTVHDRKRRHFATFPSCSRCSASTEKQKDFSPTTPHLTVCTEHGHICQREINRRGEGALQVLHPDSWYNALLFIDARSASQFNYGME